jgi:Mrp family chromosome partitioning ATPase
MSTRPGEKPTGEIETLFGDSWLADEPIGDGSGGRTRVAGHTDLQTLISRKLASPATSTRPVTGMANPEQLDAFRELRTRLLAMADGVGLTSFTTLVVSVTGGAGASFVARNLAAAFTLQEERVAMLVDCHWRRPTQQVALGSLAEKGLFDYLDQPHLGTEQLIHPTAIPGLHLIPAGHASTIPREYFSSQPMRTLIAALRQGKYFVFLDGPPTKGSPDARILSDLADFVILVTSFGRDGAEAIAQAAALFAPSKFAGVVFNER